MQTIIRTPQETNKSPTHSHPTLYWDSTHVKTHQVQSTPIRCKVKFSKNGKPPKCHSTTNQHIHNFLVQCALQHKPAQIQPMPMHLHWRIINTIRWKWHIKHLVGLGAYNLINNLQIAKQSPSLPNVLRVELHTPLIALTATKKPPTRCMHT